METDICIKTTCPICGKVTPIPGNISAYDSVIDGVAASDYNCIFCGGRFEVAIEVEVNMREVLSCLPVHSGYGMMYEPRDTVDTAESGASE